MRRKRTQAQAPAREIIINTTLSETRIALLENSKLYDLFVELPENERMVGDIYLGRVVNVVKGMRAAFVDIGHQQDAFLHFSDIGQTLAEYGTFLELDTVNTEIPERSRRPVPIEGQEILVQIIKEPISNKGARISTEISIPGRFFVLVPNSDMIGVSRKISQLKEKRRLKSIAREIRPKGFGVIIRTIADQKEEHLLRADLHGLLKSWRQIEKKLKTTRPPSLVHKDLKMASSVIRDLFTTDVSRTVVDTGKQQKEIVRYLKDVSPALIDRVELYTSKQPIFDSFGIEKEIEKSLARKVWMKSGGHLIFDHTEALVAIDVNSGKFMGKGDHDENSLKVNLEAAYEIARQLRLRDIGGIIVIDFIDMINPNNRKILYESFCKEIEKDRAQANVSQISEFGLIEMTRERIRPSLIFSYSELCPTCDGVGRIISKTTILTKIERDIRRIKASSNEKAIRLEVHPDIASFLTKGLRSHIRRIGWKYWMKIEVIENDNFKFDENIFTSQKNGEALL